LRGLASWHDDKGSCGDDDDVDEEDGGSGGDDDDDDDDEDDGSGGVEDDAGPGEDEEWVTMGMLSAGPGSRICALAAANWSIPVNGTRTSLARRRMSTNFPNSFNNAVGILLGVATLFATARPT